VTPGILDPKKVPQLQPAHALWKQYDPSSAPHRFRAGSLPDAKRWQNRTRRALGKTIGFQEMRRVPPAPRTIERVDRGDHVREKVLIRTSAHSVTPVYLLIPKGRQGPLPVVLAFHGHGYGVKDIVGLWEDGEERHAPDGYHKDFAIELCRRGFLVAAPEISCFGERQNDFSHLDPERQGVPTTCAHSAALTFHLGGSVIGLRVFEGKALVDYVQTRKDADGSRLGAMGISGGGLHTFYSTCLDRRIKACVVSGYFCTFRDSVLAMQHCFCNFVPGMAPFGEMSDLVGLIAPRPMLVEAANKDMIFPLPAVKRSVRKARKVYRVFGAESQIETDYFEGRHQISGARAYDFLWEKLC